MAEIQAARFQGLTQFALCLDGARLTPAGFDSDGDQVVDEPNDVDTVMAVQQALFDLGFPIGVDGDYGQNTFDNVLAFKVQQGLPLPPGLTEHDGITGPGTTQRLDEIFSAFGVLRLANEYGDPLPGINVDLAGSDGVVRQAVTDGDGAALVDLGGPWTVTLDPTTAFTALGDLLGRPWPPDPPPPQLDLPAENRAVVTAFTEPEPAPVLSPGQDLSVLVVSRLTVTASLVAPVEGSPRVDGTGAAVFTNVDTVQLDLQANGGFVVDVFVDPVPSGLAVPPLPDLPGWVLPNGYVVRDGDTAPGLGELFLGDANRFAELSDHDPVPGEVLTLPDAAVPSWLALATAPPLPDPQSELWLEVVPDDLLRVLYADADPAPLHDLLAVLDRPPPTGPDPALELTARAEALAARMADPEVVGPEPTPSPEGVA
jgi:hypothetical protein